MSDKTVLEQLDWALSLADKSNKVDRHKIVGRVVCENIAAIRAVLEASTPGHVEDRRDAEAEANARLARAADNIATYLADSPKSALKALTEAVIEYEAAIAAAGNHKVEG